MQVDIAVFHFFFGTSKKKEKVLRMLGCAFVRAFTDRGEREKGEKEKSKCCGCYPVLVSLDRKSRQRKGDV